MPDNQKKSPLLAPSLLAADFSIIKEEVMSVQQGGADWIHLDVMDGHFVPNLSFGPEMIRTIRTLTPLFLYCHLMVSAPEKSIEPCVQAGVKCFFFFF